MPPLSADGRDELRRLLDGRWAEQRQLARKLADRPLFVPQVGLTVEEQRRRTYDQLMALAAEGVTGIGFPTEYGGGGDLGASIVAFEMLAMGDLSLMVKVGVQFGLFGGAVLHLGNPEHHRRYLADIAGGRLLGCFAMTEHGHGSDVAALRTTATYDPAGEEFVLETPDDDARKEYIGNAARDGRFAVVFAQLVTGGESHGVHAFLLPIRDEDGNPMPGVRIADCGFKAGLNGVDNGQLWFSEVRVPRAALLDRYGSVAPDGSYSTPIENQTKRFFTMLGTLIQGRISVAGGAGSATKVALRIALHYAERRTQFTAPGRDGEVLLLDYLSHQRKLLPALAKSYRPALRAGGVGGHVARGVHRRRPGRPAAARARGSRRRHQGERHLACQPNHSDLPGGLRRRRLPGREPAARPEGRHRRVHHLRRRQHRAAAAGRQGAADQLSRPLR